MLYTFCSMTHCDDGTGPQSNVIMDAEGNLYGTAESGGAKGLGTVFKLDPTGTLTVLYAFCSVGRHCSDGPSRRPGWSEIQRATFTERPSQAALTTSAQCSS